MANGSKKRYKQYDINSLEQGCYAMMTLLGPVIIDLQKFKSYMNEAEEMCASYKTHDTIPAKEYDAVHDKVLYQQRELLRFIADHQSSSFAYIDLRQALVRRGYIHRKLCEEAQIILNELLQIRNWSFHNVQSLLVAEREIIYRSIPKELMDYVEIKPQLNPVYIRNIKSYSWDMLFSFTKHNKVRAAQFDRVLVEMKKDYEEMYLSLLGQTDVRLDQNSFQIEYITVDIEAYNAKNDARDIATLSMGIQKGQYDGSDESYKKLILP